MMEYWFVDAGVSEENWFSVLFTEKRIGRGATMVNQISPPKGDEAPPDGGCVEDQP